MSDEKRIFKKYEFYNNQFEKFTQTIGALRILGMQFSFYSQPAPNKQEEMENIVVVGRYHVPHIDHDRYNGDWHIIEVYHD